MKKNFLNKFKTPKFFLFYGILNAFFTIISLQISLIFLNIVLSTFISQTINFSLGLYFYGKRVFKVKELSILIIGKYFKLSIFLWLSNWIGIRLLYSLGLSSNLAALIMVIPIATISYFLQKNYVFKN